MKTTLIIFKKELIDTLRDRRTIITMIVIPLVLFPVIFGIVGKVMSSQRQRAEDKSLKIALDDRGNAQGFAARLEGEKGFEVRPAQPSEDVRQMIDDEALDGAYLFSEDFDEAVGQLRSGRVEILFKATDVGSSVLQRRLRKPVEEYEERLLSERFAKLELDESIVSAVDLTESNVASTRVQIGKVLGGYLPYIFIIFCFTGCMWPAIDLAAGEKERGTLETLLASPAGRFEILMGKFGVVVLTGITAAVISIVGLYVGAQLAVRIPDELMGIVNDLLQAKTILLLVSLLLPLTVFFAGMMLSLSIFAKSFKEAQSMINPLLTVVFLPALIGMLPGVELNWTTALIPILNVSLASKEIVAGTISYPQLAVVYLSLLLLAMAALFFSAKWFDRESVIFR